MRRYLPDSGEKGKLIKGFSITKKYVVRDAAMLRSIKKSLLKFLQKQGHSCSDEDFDLNISRSALPESFFANVSFHTDALPTSARQMIKCFVDFNISIITDEKGGNK